MFKDKRFRVRDVSEVIEDLEMARRTYRRVDRIFLCDGDALCLANSKLMVILEKIRELFPECQRVSVYGSAKDVLRKTPEELTELRENGIEMIYLGAESGSARVLEAVNKGVTPQQLIEAVHKIENSDIKASVTFISGLAGKAGWEDHAIETGTMISEMQPSYVGLLTLMVEPSVPMYDDIQSGKLQLLSPEEVMAETLLMLKHTNVEKKCVLRSNHASNYVSLRGNLPDDKEKMMDLLRRAMENHDMFKDERFRAL